MSGHALEQVGTTSHLSVDPRNVLAPEECGQFDEPERVVIHASYDPQVSLEWGVMPGTALCGFIFTTANYVGPSSSVIGDPRFIVEECAPCQAVHRSHVLMWQQEQR